MSKSVYLVEIDLDEDQDLKEILHEYDHNSHARKLRFDTIEDYETHQWYNEYLGA